MLVYFLVAFIFGVESIKLPPKLKVGDTVGFISPAGIVANHYPDGLVKYKQHVISFMGKLGLKVEFSVHAFGPDYGYLAATDEERAADVMYMFKNRNIAAIVANRGGWGCDRLVELLDFNVIRENPKPLVGYSDLTTLINSISHLSDIVTFHGPMGIDEWNQTWNSQFFKKVLIDGQTVNFSNQDNVPTTKIVGGKARGTLVGGNLAVFTSMIGSKFLPHPQQKFILFLEEVGESPYRVDRMLTQLQLTDWFTNVAGIVWGRCTTCNGNNFSVAQLLQQKFGNLKIPVFSGAMFGHIHEQYTLPLGTMVEIDADAGTINMLESAVN